MTTIAFLGLGAMGSRMAARLLAAGFGTTVWNRDPARAAALIAAGARLAPSPRAAASAADIVVSMVRDDAASRAVWLGEDGAFAGMRPGALGIDASTVGVAHARALATAATAAGLAVLDAPVAGSRPQAEAGKLIFLVGGAAEAVARAEPALSAMGAAVRHVGDAGAGAAAKLMVNTLLAAQAALAAELIGFARRAGVDPARAIEAVGATPVASPALQAAAGAMLADAVAPLFPIDLVVKDLGLIEAAAGAVGAPIPVASATTGAFRAAAAAGLAELNVTAIARRYA
jgi:3-hydroxyisobutyrate dehydrogenase